MKFIEYAEKLETIKYLAAHKRAGTPGYLAKKLNVSERTIQRMVQHLRDSGFPIIFSRCRCTYEVKTSHNSQ
ncbi:MAG: helix-turn-helix domain-containing protein [Pyrinomonadaceae bacterium]|nr:helix-turn-helix domain-containing protein [Sphingobacteriaceae bacterium]